MRYCAVGALRRGLPCSGRLCRGPFVRFESVTAGTSVKSGKRGGSRWFTRVLLGFLVPYTGYAVYVTVSTAQEIKYRHQHCIKGLEDPEDPRFYSFETTRMKYSPLKVLGRYENPFVEYRIQTIYEFFFNRIVELFERNRGGIPPDKRQMRALMPVHKPTWSGGEPLDHECTGNLRHDVVALEDAVPAAVGAHTTDTDEPPLYNTWLGQSCNFVVYNGLKILTDPIFSDHLLHESLGPKRITDVPCPIDKLPQPDVILVSHNHPDHLDPMSLQHWNDDNNPNTLWIVPTGMKKYLTSNNISNFIELSWWDTCELVQPDGTAYNITSTPAMHWSGRSLMDTNESLWCSFIMTHRGKPVLFHAGDTGYVKDLYIRIKNQFGAGCRLALLPCGQYCPEWHQRPRHINPSEVVKIMRDLKAQNVLGVHWGTFVLSGEYFLEPKQKLELLAEFEGIRDHCYCPELGKTVRF